MLHRSSIIHGSSRLLLSCIRRLRWVLVVLWWFTSLSLLLIICCVVARLMAHVASDLEHLSIHDATMLLLWKLSLIGQRS